MTIHFYRYKEGDLCKPQEDNIRVLKGDYNVNIQPDFSKDTYSQEEKIKRECQLLTDFMFKYLRTKNQKYLQSVQKRI